jgi:hypothetical protein
MGFAHLFLVLLLTGIAEAREMTIEEAKQEQTDAAKWNSILARSNNAEHTNDAPTLEKLRTLSLVGAEWNGTDIHSVANDLDSRSRGVDLVDGGIRFSVVMPNGSDLRDPLNRTIDSHVWIIISSRETLFNLLYTICEQTNFCFKVGKNHVTLLPWQPDSFIAPPGWIMFE